MDEDILPYDSFEIARAKASLSSELSKDSYRFLQRKINSFVRTNTNFPSNLWEGPSGRMEHIRTSFPMPVKIETDSEKSSILDETSNSDTEAQMFESNLPSKHVEYHKVVQSLHSIDPARTDNPSNISSESIDVDNKQNTSKSFQKSPDCTNNFPSPSYINLESKVIPDNSTSVNSHKDKTEKQNQIRLSKLLKKIQQAQDDLLSLKACFKKSEEEKACKKMESLHWIIHGFITSLTQEKKCWDKCNVQISCSPGNQKLHSNLKTTPLYSKTWLALKRLSSKFKNTWRLHQSTLSEYSTMDDIPKSKFQSRLKKIALGNS